LPDLATWERMVRFHWHVEHGISAHCPRGPCALVEGGVRHIEAESEVAGQKETLPLIFTMPPAYLSDGAIQDVGVVLAHSDAVEWRSTLLTELAAALAASGAHLVKKLVRCRCWLQEELMLHCLVARCVLLTLLMCEQASSLCASAASTLRRTGSECARRHWTRWPRRPMRAVCRASCSRVRPVGLCDSRSARACCHMHGLPRASGRVHGVTRMHAARAQAWGPGRAPRRA